MDENQLRKSTKAFRTTSWTFEARLVTYVEKIRCRDQTSKQQSLRLGYVAMGYVAMLPCHSQRVSKHFLEALLHRIYILASKTCIVAMLGYHANIMIMCRAQPTKLKAEPNVRVRHGPELLNWWTKWGHCLFFLHSFRRLGIPTSEFCSDVR